MEPTASRTESPSAIDEQQHSAEARKASVLAETAPSKTSSIADAAMLKHLGVFVVCDRDSRIPLEPGHGLGIYHRDCRYVCGYELGVGGRPLQALASSCATGARSRYELVNLELEAVDGKVIQPYSLAVHLERTIDGSQLTVTDTLDVTNYADSAVRVTASLTLDVRFEDLFSVRGQARQPQGEIDGPHVEGDRVSWRYRGTDDVVRRVHVRLPEGARACASDPESAPTVQVIEFELALDANAERRLTIQVQLEDEWRGTADDAPARRGGEQTAARFACDVPSVERAVTQAFSDIEMLSARWDGHRFVMAGMPWFTTLFGRDASLVALQLLPYDIELAADTARLLAQHQGRRDEPWQDEQPGKILHELRRNELTNCGRLPYAPYYGSIDATPLFVMLVAQAARAAGSLELLHELREHVDAALGFIDRCMQDDPDGLLAYSSEISGQMIQKGWRDSCDGVVDVDGRIATSPVALIEVQAYVWAAWMQLAPLLERAGEPERARELHTRAERLRERVHERFVSERLGGTFALARWGEDARVAEVASSNPGHALWCGIASDEVADHTAQRLLADDMFSGWGVRTLGIEEVAFNPVSYHRGSVWPHDNAIIAAGLRRYGFDDAALRICDGILDAARSFESSRLPELFSGSGRDAFPLPVRYPVACHPQAWAAGALPMLVHVLAGLEVDGFQGVATFRRPLMPDACERVVLRGIEIGARQLDVCLERRERDGREARVRVLDSSDEVDVRVEEG